MINYLILIFLLIILLWQKMYTTPNVGHHYSIQVTAVTYNRVHCALYYDKLLNNLVSYKYIGINVQGLIENTSPP